MADQKNRTIISETLYAMAAEIERLSAGSKTLPTAGVLAVIRDYAEANAPQATGDPRTIHDLRLPHPMSVIDNPDDTSGCPPRCPARDVHPRGNTRD